VVHAARNESKPDRYDHDPRSPHRRYPLLQRACTSRSSNSGLSARRRVTPATRCRGRHSHVEMGACGHAQLPDTRVAPALRCCASFKMTDTAVSPGGREWRP
jgi:hypothetical protein